MQYRILPYNIQFNVKKAYKRKVFFAWVGIVILGFAIISIFLTATYVALNTKKVTEEVLIAHSTLSEEQKEYNEVQKITEELVEVLEPIVRPVKYTALVDRTVASMTSGITLSNFVFEDTQKEGVVQLTVTGIANTRSQLQLFEQSLRKQPLFQGVEIPIAQLVGRQTVKFSVVITSQL